MTKISNDIWQRLRTAGIIDTYDKDIRNREIRDAGPANLMKISGIGPRVAYNLLKIAGEEYTLNYLERVYNQLKFRTNYEFVKATPKIWTVEREPKFQRPKEEEIKRDVADTRQRRYIAFLIRNDGKFNDIFESVKKNNGIPYNGSVPHKLLHITVVPPAEILLRDILAKMHAIADFALPSSFEIKEFAPFPNSAKAIFAGSFDVPSKFVKTPHMTFAEFKTEEECSKFCNQNNELVKQFIGMKMEIESLGIVRKDYGIEYAIPITAFLEEKRTFIPEQIRTFLEFLGHKSPIKYQVFKPAKNNVRQGSGRNAYAQNAEEVVNLAAMDNGKGIICVAISEHGNKQAEDITNIKKILALTIDVDVKKERKAGYVSSEDDHRHAINIAYTIVKKELEKMGFTVGIIDDSGNGAHEFVKVDIDMPESITAQTWPQTEIYGRLVTIEKTLRNKIEEMNDQVVNIDFLTKDVVRRIKLPGTKNKKDEEQIEDRLCRIIYQAPDYAEAKNTEAFFAITPNKKDEAVIYEQSGEPVEESTAVVDDKEIERILNIDEKLKALFNGKITKHGEDKPLEFKNGEILCKSRSEAENALVSGLVSHGIRNFKQMDAIMMKSKIGKWQEDKHGGYKRTTFDKALRFVKTTKIDMPISEDVVRFRKNVNKLL